jgi:hypothetical protein
VLPVGTPTTPPTAPTAPADPRAKLRAATLTRRSGRLTLAGSSARSFTGKVRVTVRVRVGNGWKQKGYVTTVRRGVLKATLVLPTAWTRSARTATVAVWWPGSARFAASSVSRTVRIR